MEVYLVGQGQGGERRHAFGPLDAHEQEASRRLAHRLRGHLVEVHGSAADFMGVLEEQKKKRVTFMQKWNE